MATAPLESPRWTSTAASTSSGSRSRSSPANARASSAPASSPPIPATSRYRSADTRMRWSPRSDARDSARAEAWANASATSAGSSPAPDGTTVTATTVARVATSPVPSTEPSSRTSDSGSTASSSPRVRSYSSASCFSCSPRVEATAVSRRARSPNSSRRLVSRSGLRSPATMASAAATVGRMGRVIRRASHTPSSATRGSTIARTSAIAPMYEVRGASTASRGTSVTTTHCWPLTFSGWAAAYTGPPATLRAVPLKLSPDSAV